MSVLPALVLGLTAAGISRRTPGPAAVAER
jgi:hypothetical protein